MDDNGLEVQIIDYKPNEPLFNFRQEVEIDKTWMPNIKGTIVTTIGRLIVNKLVFFDNAPEAFSYINEPMTVSGIEESLALKVKNSDEPMTKENITVSQMVSIVDNLNFLTNISQIVNVAATYKVITPPPGLEKVKEKLLIEYKDQLTDPVKVVELENKLNEVDKEYLKDDIAASKVFDGKAKTSRKKMYMMFGSSLDFTNDASRTPVLKSLSEGLDTSEKEFPKYINDLRLASFSRGSFTALSGYSYKILQRSLANIEILPNECNTTIGVTRDIDNSNYTKLINRYIMNKGKWTLVGSKQEASTYLGKRLQIRSTMYCTAGGNKVCYKCVSDSYKDKPNGTTNIASQISSVLMTMFLKLMHGGEVQTADIKMTDLVC
jgi:hypothetical protein